MISSFIPHFEFVSSEFGGLSEPMSTQLACCAVLLIGCLTHPDNNIYNQLRVVTFGSLNRSQQHRHDSEDHRHGADAHIRKQRILILISQVKYSHECIDPLLDVVIRDDNRQDINMLHYCYR